MASNISFKTLALLALALALCVQGTLGGIACENLDQDTCAFAVASTGKRCVLEKHVKRSGEEAYTCRTSEIVADKLKDLVETDQCIKACVFLPKLCEAQEENLRRGLSEIRSSGFVAPGPVQPAKLTVAPIVAPALAPF
ncbi:hypothetical protein FH972_025350 [Carpinus fangiana]|uniref:PAR1 protein n=1 Tax=Carpinus fangiana TaxID=176857 RepID=A0A5N6L102_9ROSI|nr:hypothetical protein FH972_025350 [Carpinus fangiana]